MPDVSLININNTDINIKDATARTAVADEVTARKAADANYTGDNKVSTVSGDYTVLAGDITETADNITIHGKQSVLIDSDGNYTEDVVGKRKITAKENEEIYSGTHSEHVTGVTTKAYDNNVTESIDGTYSRIVTGAITETHQASETISGTNSAENMTGIKSIAANDIRFTATNSAGAVTYSKPTSDGKLVTVPYKDTDGNIYKVLCEGTTIDSDSKTKLLIVGDSYAVGESPQGIIESYATKIKNAGVFEKVEVLAGGGYGFAATNKWINLLNSYTGDADINTVLVAGGFNDKDYATATILAAINDFVVACQTKFGAQVKIIIACIAGSTVPPDVEAIANKVIPAYCSAPKTAYLVNSESILVLPKYITSDGAHPNEAGQTLLYQKILAGLIGGCCNVSESVQLAPTAATHVTLTNASGLLRVLNDVVIINFATIHFQYTGTLNAQTLTKIADIPELKGVIFNDYYGVPAVGHVNINNVYHDVNMMFYVGDGGLFVYVMNVADNGIGYLPLTDPAFTTRLAPIIIPTINV